MNSNSHDYCGIVFIGGGSSWAYGSTPDEAAKKAAKICKADWGRHFDIKRGQKMPVNVYDMKKHDGWVADTMHGVIDPDTKERIERVDVITVTI